MLLDKGADVAKSVYQNSMLFLLCSFSKLTFLRAGFSVFLILSAWSKKLVPILLNH